MGRYHLSSWAHGFNDTAGIADFERSLIGERTSAGRAAVKAKCVRFGPKPILIPEQIAHARRLIEEWQSVAEVARILGVH